MDQIRRNHRLFDYMALLLVGALGLTSLAAARAGASEWQAAEQSRIRLISASGVSYQDMRVTAAALQIELADGWKTYWRTPGDGLAPSIEWQGSENIKDIKALWPAPKRIEAPPGIIAYGYERQVTVPFILEAKDRAQPMRLRLQLVYGVCADLCIPVETTLALEIPAEDHPGQAPLLEEVLTRVPRSQTDEADCAHRLTGAERVTRQGKTTLILHTSHDAGTGDLDVFAEHDKGLIIPPAVKTAQSGDGRLTHLIEFEYPEDAKALEGESIRLTMTSDRGSCETIWRVK